MALRKGRATDGQQYRIALATAAHHVMTDQMTMELACYQFAVDSKDLELRIEDVHRRRKAALSVAAQLVLDGHSVEAVLLAAPSVAEFELNKEVEKLRAERQRATTIRIPRRLTNLWMRARSYARCNVIYFTADHHFGHENVLGYCERPFSSVGEMDEEMIGRWNDVVCRDDVVYHLGDFTLGGRDDAGYYFRRLNGIVRILGYSWHHDRHWLRNWYDVGHVDVWTANGHEVEVLKSMAVLEHDPPIVLCHYPLAEWDRKHYGAWHLHGHSHGNYKAPGKILDVGVDATGFYPLSLETVEQIMGEL